MGRGEGQRSTFLNCSQLLARSLQDNKLTCDIARQSHDSYNHIEQSITTNSRQTLHNTSATRWRQLQPYGNQSLFTRLNENINCQRIFVRYFPAPVSLRIQSRRKSVPTDTICLQIVSSHDLYRSDVIFASQVGNRLRGLIKILKEAA